MIFRGTMDANKDQYGFEYYEWPSQKWKLAKNIWHFVEVDPKYEDNYRVKIGMKYIIYSGLRNVYELYEISEHSRDTDLLPYIKQARLFLLS